MEWYERIRQCRESLEMSQETLAEKCGYVSRSSIAKIEAGNTDIPLSKLMQFARSLNVTPQKLMGWVENSSEVAKALQVTATDRFLIELTVHEKQLLEYFRSLDEAGQERAIESIEGLVAVGKYARGGDILRDLQGAS